MKYSVEVERCEECGCYVDPDEKYCYKCDKPVRRDNGRKRDSASTRDKSNKPRRQNS